MIFQVSAGPRASQNPSKKRLESRVGFEHHFSEFFRFWVDFGSQNGGQNGEKIDKKRGQKKDAILERRGGWGALGVRRLPARSWGCGGVWGGKKEVYMYTFIEKNAKKGTHFVLPLYTQ